MASDILILVSMKIEPIPEASMVITPPGRLDLGAIPLIFGVLAKENEWATISLSRALASPRASKAAQLPTFSGKNESSWGTWIAS